MQLQCNWVPIIYAQYMYCYWYLKVTYWYLYWYLSNSGVVISITNCYIRFNYFTYFTCLLSTWYKTDYSICISHAAAYIHSIQAIIYASMKRMTDAVCVCDIRAVRDYRVVVRQCTLTWSDHQRRRHRRHCQLWRVTRVVQRYVVTVVGRRRAALWAPNSATVLSEYCNSYITLRYTTTLSSF